MRSPIAQSVPAIAAGFAISRLVRLIAAAASTRSRKRNASGLAARVSAARSAEDDEPAAGDRDERGEREREAEAVGERRRDDRRGRDDREEPGRPDGCVAPGLAQDEREGGGRDGCAQHREQPDPGERGERVVEDAVADERVAARVPVVRPEREPVLEVDVELEDVGGEVGAGRRAPGDQGGERRRPGPRFAASRWLGGSSATRRSRRRLARGRSGAILRSRSAVSRR